MQSDPYRFCPICGDPSLSQMLEKMKELSLAGVEPTDNDFMGIMSDLSKIANGQFKPCQCHPRAWAINQKMWWSP